MRVFVNLYLILHFASVFATMVFKWPSQTITVLTDILHNLIHSAAKFGFYLGISDAPSNANFWMWCHITVICFLITNMALKTTLLIMAFSFLFNFVNVIEGSKTNDEDNIEKSHNHTCKKREIPEIYLRNFFWIFCKILGWDRKINTAPKPSPEVAPSKMEVAPS